MYASRRQLSHGDSRYDDGGWYVSDENPYVCLTALEVEYYQSAVFGPSIVNYRATYNPTPYEHDGDECEEYRYEENETMNMIGKIITIVSVVVGICFLCCAAFILWFFFFRKPKEQRSL